MEHVFGSISTLQIVFLILALALAFGFECVNGFHDTANAVATVIYTHSLPPTVAVVWSGICNLLGVLLSNGAVAFSVVALLPVELVLQCALGGGLRDDLFAADFCHYLESRYLVFGAARLELPHAFWLDHGSGTYEFDAAFGQFRGRGQLAKGREHRARRCSSRRLSDSSARPSFSCC